MHPVESLSPEFSISRVSLASLLTPVREYTSQFTSACVFEALSGHACLVAKRGELGNSSEEVLVSVDWVSQRESIVPLLLCEDGHDSLDVVASKIVVSDEAIDSEW